MNGLAGIVHRDPASREGAQRLDEALAAHHFAGAAPRLRLDAPGVTVVAMGDGIRREQNDDGWLVADLDVSNLDELAEAAGVSRGAPDLLLRLGTREGPAFLRRLRGAFVLAMGDDRGRRVLLAADRFGLRRLYHAAGPDGVGFGTRAVAALLASGSSRAVDADAAYAFLNFETVPAPQTIYRAVRRLAAGHALSWRDARLGDDAYAELAYRETPVDAGRAAAELRARTEDAVRAGLVGLQLKETGAFLSGGTDSSTVVGLMTRLSGERVNAFSIGFADARYDELGYAELAARHFSAAHYTKLVTADDAFQCLPDLVAAYDEPFGNNSVIPTYLCARLARESGVHTLFAGDGGDEIFGGNERYRREQIFARYRRIPAPLRGGLLEPALARLSPGRRDLLGKAQRYVERARTPNPDRFYASEFYVHQERARLLHPDFMASITPDWPLEVARRHYRAAGETAELNRLLYLDMKITLADNDLFKVTRTADLAGIGVRFPLLDPPLVEFMAGLPADLKVRGTEKRFLFKRAVADLLPGEILAKRKHGFGLPISDWLKQHAGFRELLRDTLGARAARERGYFAAGAVESLFERHAADATPFYGGLLWRVLMLELWHLRHGGRA